MMLNKSSTTNFLDEQVAGPPVNDIHKNYEESAKFNSNKSSGLSQEPVIQTD
jgi:hypothetical protein